MLLKRDKIKSPPGYRLWCKCNMCGKEFTRSYFCAKREERHFCGMVCKGKFRSITYVGAKATVWKGGKKHCVGYLVIKTADHPYGDKRGYVMEHRLVMEKHLNRYLKPDEFVHHINEDKLDNRIENLELFEDISKHLSYHRGLRESVS